MRRFPASVSCVVAVMILAAPADARQDRGPAPANAPEQGKPCEQPPAPKPTPNVAQETPKPSPAAIPETPPRAGHLANVRLDVTITDQRATGQPTSKTVSLTLVDRASGRIRTTGDVPVQIKTGGGVTNFQSRSVMLNIDARPELIRDGRIRAEITLEYRPTGNEPSTDEQLPTTISESITVLLEDGKPLVVSQSADPITDRRVRVEVKATILK